MRFGNCAGPGAILAEPNIPLACAQYDSYPDKSKGGRGGI